VPAGLPPYLASLFRDAALLPRERETDLFRRMNYLKFRATKLREALDPSRARSSDLDEIERLQDEALAIKNQIVQANLRLVVAIAKKRVSPAADLFELISDGNMSLMQAAEKFDFARGFKFSTYASWAIIRNFARSQPAERERRERFVTGLVEQFEVAADSDDDEQQYESDLLRERDTIQAMLGRLDPRERQILINRFGLDGSDKLTLVQLGRELGVTKERVRQLELRARSKLLKYAWVRRSAPDE
jgi:RNA polymerase primary sigma factor